MSQQQWQPKLGDPGVRVEGLAELQQSLSIILTTPVGSVPGRPEFGSRLHELIDAPLAEQRAKAPQETQRAVRASDPRITVIDVSVGEGSASGGAVCQVYWRPTAQTDAASTMTEVPLT